jgi:ABC-2 type transport system permease protein
MSSNLVTTEQQDRPPDGPNLGAPMPEVAPSTLREDDLSMPRTLGMAGAVLVFASTIALIARMSSEAGTLLGIKVNAGWALLLMMLGLCGLLYHAAFDREVMFRRLYLLFAIALVLVGVVLCLIPKPKDLGDQLRLGAPCLFVALMFFAASLRNEEDEAFRRMMESILGAAGGLLTLTAVIMLLLVTVASAGIQRPALFPLGLVLAGFGLVYLVAFVKSRGISDDYAYYAALGLIAAGVTFGLVTLFRWLSAGTSSGNYFSSVGMLLFHFGLVYVVVGVMLASDLTVFVLLRRELGALFLSPIMYLALFGFCAIWFLNTVRFYNVLFPDPGSGIPTPNEPIVRDYALAWFPVITVVLAIPVLTMGTFSEEQRSGTIEVLLTAPVNDSQVLLSKFFACWVAYLVMWAPAGLYLLALVLAGAAPFDYRPLLSYLVMLEVWGFAFVAMGVFFSSLTRQMLVAAVLCFAAMLAWTFLGILAFNLSEYWKTILSPLSYIHAWDSGLEGKIVPRFLLFPTAITLFFLFLTHKVLESRRWR